MNRIVHCPAIAPRSPWLPPTGVPADARVASPRPSVWDERARKMGFPPTPR